MRLLNTTTLEFKEFLGTNIPKYAILSHVWSSEEVSYEEYLAGKGKDGAGYRKIVKLCELARNPELIRQPVGEQQSLDWAWIDTCCIDKTSSAELSEAINAMFNWYEHATVCFVFLPDVDHMSSDQEDTRQDPKGLGARFSKQQFLDSKWFTRGWTLQELLAPSRVLFFNKTFEAIGEKVQYNRYTPFHMLNNLISEAAGISIYAQGEGEHEFTCIAQKMCWASRRVTTREEDVAYCLLGLFKVNMPLLYGEGSSKAFLRLQLEILASSNDDSIFAWDVSTDASLPNQERPWSGLLAPSPRNFANCSEIRRIDSWSLNSHWTKKATYTITHRGIEMSMPRLIRSNLGKSPIEQVLYPLMCESGRYQKLYLKLWIENPERGGSPYADGARVAWRSGCVVSPTAVPYNRRAFRSANRLHLQMQLEFCGLSEPKLIRLTDVEDRFGLQWGSATHSFRDWGKTYWMYLVGAEFLALSKAAGEKLCFTTTWEEFESPDWKFRHTEL